MINIRLSSLTPLLYQNFLFTSITFRTHEVEEGLNNAPRTLYVKGYPTDDPDVTIDSIRETFSEYGKILMITKRRLTSKTFKGSVFIEYENKECVDKAVEATHKNGVVQLKFKGKEFACIMRFEEWFENHKKKAALLKDKKEKKLKEKQKEDETKKRKVDGGAETKNLQTMRMKTHPQRRRLNVNVK